MDACILYSAARSHTGGSARIILEAKARGIMLVSSRTAFDEAKRSILEDLSPEALNWLIARVKEAPEVWDLVEEITAEEISRWRPVTVEKDLHVLAGAVKGQADVLVTLDRKHLLKAGVRAAFPGKIMDTREFWRAIREETER